MDLKKPGIHVEVKDGKTVATICAAQAMWCRVNDPEPMLDNSGAPKMDRNGNAMRQWRVQLRVDKDTPGARELMQACVDLRKSALKGVGKIPACKDGDKEFARLVEEMGKDPEKVADIKGKLLINANSTIQPIVHNEVYSGCIATAVISLASYDRDGSKGIKAYLQEIGRVAPGERLAGAARQPTLEASAFEADDAPAVAPAPAQKAPAAADDDLPWE